QPLQPQAEGLSPPGLRDFAGVQIPRHPLRLRPGNRPGRGDGHGADPGRAPRRPGGYVHHGVHRQQPDEDSRRQAGDAPGLSPAMSILLFGGTAEGHSLARRLAQAGLAVTCSVATAYGEAVLEPTPGLTVHVGRMDADQMAAEMAK